MPGPGGSLGYCAICGDTFTVDILMGREVHLVSVVGIDGDVCSHQKCFPALERAREEGWETLPNGPLRSLFAEVASKRPLPAAVPEAL